MLKIKKEDWFSVINECRNSGLSDRQWCHENDIAYSTFYYHMRRLKREACELPESTRTCTIPVKQEVVQLTFDNPLDTYEPKQIESAPSCAIMLQVNNVTLHISNHASATVISNTISALQGLC